MVGETQQNNETKALRNPTDKTWMLLLSLPPFLLIWAFWSTCTADSMSIPDLAVIAISGLIYLYLLASGWKLFYSPYEVEVGETVLLRYRGRTDLRNIESMEEVYFSPTHGKKIWSREFPYGGVECHVKFSGDRHGIKVTYEVAKALYDAYMGRMGKAPPLMSGSMTVK